MKRQKGFSLIELLIVVAIILIIAAIAIPNLLRSRIAANEASAVAALRTITTAEISYQTSNPDVGYASLSVLGNGLSEPNTACTPSATTACLLDPQLSSGLKSGYKFDAIATAAAADGSTPAVFVATAVPQSVGSSGIRGFCVNESAVIRFNADGTKVEDCAETMSPIS